MFRRFELRPLKFPPLRTKSEAGFKVQKCKRILLLLLLFELKFRVFKFFIIEFVSEKYKKLKRLKWEVF